MLARDLDGLQIMAPTSAPQLEAVIDLTGKAFWQYFRWQRHCREAYFVDSFYDPRASRIGVLDGQVVSHFGVWGHRMRIGSSWVRVAGIGAVATHGHHLRQGLMARTAAACVEDLAGHGYDMTILFGIRDFYHRFGYVRAWAQPTWSVRIKDLPPKGRALRLRRISDEWVDLAPLANRTLAGLTATAVRPTYRHNPDSEHQTGYLWTGPNGEPAGYVVVNARNPDRLDVVDHGGDAETVLRAVAQLARRDSLPELRFPSLHTRSALCRLLRRGTCRLEQQYVRRGSVMVRTTSLLGVLTRMQKELGRRLAASGLIDWSGVLLFADPRERVVLEIEKSRVTAAPAGKGLRPDGAVRGGEEIAQLLIGTDEPLEVAAAGGIRLSGEARRVLPVLFPNEHPCLPAWDHY